MREPVFNETVQLGIVVRDLEATVRRYVDDYGIGPWEFAQIDLGDANNYREYGRPVERSNRIAMATVGRVMWELIEPLDEEGEISTNVLGATNLYVNATTQSEEASWALIRYFTAPEQQKLRAIEGARIPVLKSSYEDEQLLEEVPVMELGKKALQTVRPRPVCPYYSDMSLEMAEQFNAILAGETSPEQDAKTLQRNLWKIIEQGENL